MGHNILTKKAEAASDALGGGGHGVAVTQKSLTDDCLKMIGIPGPLWWAVFILDLCILSLGLIAERNQIVNGVGVAGQEAACVRHLGEPAPGLSKQAAKTLDEGRQVGVVLSSGTSLKEG